MKIETLEVGGMYPAIVGMRNPLASWSKSDSRRDVMDSSFTVLGPVDEDLAARLVQGGTEHAKFQRQIVVWADITAPRYWWEQEATYRMGAERNSTSTMHTLHKRNLTYDDFEDGAENQDILAWPIAKLNELRTEYLNTGDRAVWRKMVALLPQSFLQKRTVMYSYQTIASMCRQRKGHKLQEWHAFIGWAHTLPYADALIFGQRKEAENEPEL